LVADIERGGTFASIYGTIGLLNPEHRQMVKGIVINKFRGDESLLEPAIQRIEELVNVPVIGIVPYLEGLMLPQEDSQALGKEYQSRVDIAVLRLPRISNFTDFDPLSFDNRVNIRYISNPRELKSPDALIIPGTKSTIDDLGWLKREGFDSINELKGKIPIIGICGGFQILGTRIDDKGVEKGKTSVEGLGLLDIETSFESYDKTTRPVSGEILASRGLFEGMKGSKVSGYEIHMGNTSLKQGAQPIFKINGKFEGASDPEFMTFGTYLHGLFDSPNFREGFINFLMKNKREKSGIEGVDIKKVWEESIEMVAKTVNKCVDLSWFYEK
jgi:adenosylcobyric acid synthase